MFVILGFVLGVDQYRNLRQAGQIPMHEVTQIKTSRHALGVLLWLVMPSCKLDVEPWETIGQTNRMIDVG